MFGPGRSAAVAPEFVGYSSGRSITQCPGEQPAGRVPSGIPSPTATVRSAGRFEHRAEPVYHRFTRVGPVVEGGSRRSCHAVRLARDPTGPHFCPAVHGRGGDIANCRGFAMMSGQDGAMGTFTLGTLSSVPGSLRPDLLAAPTRAALEATGLLGSVGVAEIDPSLSDTAATQQAFDLHGDMLANCVVVGGKREGTERLAACVVLATTRADVNGMVKRYLDVRKASFLPMERAVDLTGMEYGGITPIGLPRDWPVLVDRRVAGAAVVVIGSGVRRSKILVPGALLAELPAVQVIDGLGL